MRPFDLRKALLTGAGVIIALVIWAALPLTGPPERVIAADIASQIANDSHWAADLCGTTTRALTDVTVSEVTHSAWSWTRASGTARVTRRAAADRSSPPYVEISVQGSTRIARTSGYVSGYTLGERVPVAYSPSDPSRAVVVRQELFDGIM